ncbi:nitroreductase family protein [Loigolactobacillus backii]|uniref:NAD(P)H-dependent quinone reductase n=1 Tax=Loigolactobacillus backii TaxID=375175 RepID=A0A192H0U7_9LACO|nr:nitroreductase family protein [Loigolactobacillus backii]ANK60568.1 NAD(P)H-dependent quinone reductase [Loigolactobacillus backii]ANK61867.1 NAD(P)H-dependent quinone reductase [Loigolactobacillus backii]ANK65521.1 NAD(P)H-dependent quinone reductase [Loigolactobacillus backii]ANK67992.1 NAD(P)H-dependent quinone reductase [Loigolactobacillus backii]ANK68939.1 NAD(P)H-dependent quinone reductase [Loigolactobacillus backii]
MATLTEKGTFVNNDLADVILKRQSIRNYDKSVKISHDEMTTMIKEAITAPSACNLQAWHFVVVDTPAGKDKLRSFFMHFNTPQLETSSAMVMIFGDTLAFKSYRNLWNKAYDNGQISAEKRDEVFKTFLPLYESASKEMLTADATVDSALAAMQFMLVARGHGYATNPIAGYDATKAAAAMGLDPDRYVPVMAVAIGKPAPDDKDEVKSVRYEADQVVQFK